MISGHLIGKADKNNEELQESLKARMSWLKIDTIIKIIGLIVSFTLYPPAMMISVYITFLVIVLPAQYKAAKIENRKH